VNLQPGCAKLAKVATDDRIDTPVNTIRYVRVTCLRANDRIGGDEINPVPSRPFRGMRCAASVPFAGETVLERIFVLGPAELLEAPAESRKVGLPDFISSRANVTPCAATAAHAPVPRERQLFVAPP